LAIVSLHSKPRGYSNHISVSKIGKHLAIKKSKKDKALVILWELNKITAAAKAYLESKN
jgi:hypothetical protein